VAEDDPLLKLLRSEEGLRLHSYKDSLGYDTVGYGRCIDARAGGGITLAEAEYLLANDAAKVRNQLTVRLPWYLSLDQARKTVLEAMAFQLGTTGLLGFSRMLDFMEKARWKEAAAEMRSSLWFKQTQARADRFAKVIEDGKLP